MDNKSRLNSIAQITHLITFGFEDKNYIGETISGMFLPEVIYICDGGVQQKVTRLISGMTGLVV